ncbi:MAG: hypothetical protein ACTSU5_04500 [Promethearchaeota archaeon]
MNKLAKALESMIDEAVSREFEVRELTDQDRENNSYKAIRFTLEFNGIEVKYVRKVISPNTPVVPREQYLFGFSPKEGLCLLTTKHEHKFVLCETPLKEDCMLINSLTYLLVQKDEFKVWSYIPPCVGCNDINCKTRDLGIELRTKLYVYEK